MGKITAIKTQKRKGRFNVFVDGKYTLAVTNLTLLEAHLSVGMELSEDEVEKLIRRVAFQTNLEKAINFLSFRPRSRQEVESYLIKGKLAEAERQQVIAKLTELKLLDDREFAKWWIEQRRAFRPKGMRLVQQELRQKGIEPEVIAEFSSSSRTEADSAQQLLTKAWGKWAKLSPVEAKKKAMGYLGRRGFSWETIKRVIDRVSRDEIE